MDLKDKINPINTALVVVDIQNDFASPDGLLGKMGRDFSMVPVMLNNLNSLVDRAKSSNVEVLYTQQIYDRSKLTPLQLEQYDLDGKLATCDINTDGYKFYKIDPPKDDVYIKYNFNIFSNNDLSKRLRDKNIKTLIITGMDIIYCVETAVRNAFDLGFKVVVPEDAIAGNAKYPEINNNTIEMFRKFGVVVKTQDILDIWSK